MIAKHGVPVTAFVNAGRLCDGLDPGSLVALLTLWVEAGAELGNHTFSHPSLDSVTLEQYIADIKLGEPAVESAQGKSPRYFRHPFLRRGATNAKKEGLEAFLKEAGYIEAPVTLDNSEWMFARAARLVQYKMSLKGRAIPIQDEPDGDPLGGQEQSSCGRWEAPCSKPNR